MYFLVYTYIVYNVHMYIYVFIRTINILLYIISDS